MDTIRGIGTSPWVVGLVRGATHAAIVAIVAYLIVALDAADLPANVEIYVPLLILLLRTVEGTLDQADSKKGPTSGIGT